MDELKAQQIEALQVASPYCEKMIEAINRIIGEYSGNKLPDTNEYMLSIVKGLNWIFEVYNGTYTLINQDEVVIDKETVNNYVSMINKANEEDDDKKRVEAFKGILSFVEIFKSEADRLASCV